MIGEYWRLACDPFAGPGGEYVPTPVHDEAVARLRYAVEAGERMAVLRAGAGLGKSVVLARALAELRDPRRKIATAAAPIDGAMLFADLARGCGATLSRDATRAEAWRSLSVSARLCRLQGLALVLAVDDDQHLETDCDRRDLGRLAQVDPHPAARIAVLRVGRGREPGAVGKAWDLAVRLQPLTRSESGAYIQTKLARAGATEATFAPKALLLLHQRARGVPRGLDRLASLALLVGATRRDASVTADAVEAAAAALGVAPHD